MSTFKVNTVISYYCTDQLFSIWSLRKQIFK